MTIKTGAYGLVAAMVLGVGPAVAAGGPGHDVLRGHRDGAILLRRHGRAACLRQLHPERVVTQRREQQHPGHLHAQPCYTVALDGGTTTLTVNARAMTDGTHDLTYALYNRRRALDALGRGGTLSTQTVAGTGNGSPQMLTVYGRIPVAQYVAGGSYSDTVNVTVSY